MVLLLMQDAHNTYDKLPYTLQQRPTTLCPVSSGGTAAPWPRVGAVCGCGGGSVVHLTCPPVVWYGGRLSLVYSHSPPSLTLPRGPHTAPPPTPTA